MRQRSGGFSPACIGATSCSRRSIGGSSPSDALRVLMARR
jgi:hypothetical protein